KALAAGAARLRTRLGCDRRDFDARRFGRCLRTGSHRRGDHRGLPGPLRCQAGTGHHRRGNREFPGQSRTARRAADARRHGLRQRIIAPRPAAWSLPAGAADFWPRMRPGPPTTSPRETALAVYTDITEDDLRDFLTQYDV